MKKLLLTLSLLIPIAVYASGIFGGGGGSGTTSPLTTKGDVWGFSGANDRLPVGTDGQAIIADSASSLGIKYSSVPTGSGTTNRTAKFSSATALAAATWQEDTNGEQHYKGTQKGTASAPLMQLSDTTASGFYLDSTNVPAVTEVGVQVAAFPANGMTLYHSSGDKVATTVGSTYLIKATGATAATGEMAFRAYDTAAIFALQDVHVNDLLNINALTVDPTESTLANSIIFSGAAAHQSYFLHATREGLCTGASGGKCNAMTVIARANGAITGTTTVNSSTTVTGTSTIFAEELGIGDEISVSSAAGTYARITAIASATSLTVDQALGNGSSQTINKKEALASWQNSARTVVAEINAAGKFGCRTGVTCGTATCNGTTEVTVTTAEARTASIIQLTEQVTGGTPLGDVYVSSRNDGVSFGFKCAAADTSTVGWVLWEPR